MPGTPVGEAPGRGRRVLTGSATRSLGNAVYAFISLLTGAVVARRLGPNGKGFSSTMSYLAALGWTLAAAGLGDAAVVLVQSGRATFDRAIRATVAALLLTGSVVAVLGFAVGALLYSSLPDDLLMPLLALALSVVFGTVVLVGCLVLEGRGQLIYSTVVRVAVATSTLAATLVLIQRWWLTGAMAALAFGWAIGAVLVVFGLRAEGANFRPRWDGAYLASALRFGMHVQVAQLLLVLAARVDLVILQAVRGADAVGLYSVAISMASIVAFAPSALSSATYPVIASLPRPEAISYTFRAARLSGAAAVVLAAAMCVLIPFVTPLAFGTDFGSSVAPALGLLPGVVFFSVQLTLTRARAAAGAPRLLVASFGTTLVTMIVVDLLLIPPLGLSGAVLASVGSSAAGAAVAVAGCWRAWKPECSLLVLVPRPRDVWELVMSPRELLRGPARTQEATVSESTPDPPAHRLGR